jgi:hypothetical protein
VRTAKVPYAHCSAMPWTQPVELCLKRSCLPPAPKNMHRFIAKMLSAVLLAGTCGPFVFAMGLTSAAGVHCKRKSLQAVRVEETPSCHRHHAAALADQSVEKHDSSEPSVRASQCCAGHECCRSTVRSRWAQPCLTADVRAVARAETLVSAQAPQFQSSELSAYYPARAPPAL